MDVAALALAIDSNDVVKAANDLDRFSAAAAKAGTSVKAPASGAAAMAQDMARSATSAGAAATQLGGFSNAATRAAAAAQSAARASSAASSSVIDFGRGIDLLTGKVNSNFVAINRNIAAWGKHRQAINDNAGATFAAGNAAAQFQDIVVTSTMGMSPFLIALQQGTQLAGTMQGGIKSLGAAVMQLINPMSLLAIGLTLAIALLIQWAMEALKSADNTDKLSKAIEKTKITTYAFSDAQSALGGVIDLTTGKIKTQSAALYGLARAQLEMIRATAIRDRSEATKTIAEQRGRNRVALVGMTGSATAGTMGLVGRDMGPNQSQALLDQFSSGKLTSTQAIDGMERLRKAGKLTEDQFIKLTGAVASFGVAGENLKVYEDARKALAGDQGALKQFLTPDKSRGGGGKSDAEKLVDIYASAQADIATEKARGLAEANSLGAMEAAKLEKQTALLNTIQQRGIPITEAVRTKVAELAGAYATAKVDADMSKVVNDTTDGIQRQRDAIADQAKLVGLYGDALARARREMDAERALRESLPKGEIYVGGKLTSGLSDDAEALARSERMERVRRDAELAAYAMDLERRSIGLTGAAALEYAFIADRLIEAKRAGIELSPAEIAAINAAGEAYATQRHAIDQQRRAIEDSREVTRSFFTDWINGVREGANVFKSFADSVVNSLNRILDKLLDRGLDSLLDSMFKIGSSALTGSAGGMDLRGFSFANGGAFTNSVVNTPTLFRFANGAALGEMGEAGPEAIMPLKRGPNGALGVQMHGGGGKPSVQINTPITIAQSGSFTTEDARALAVQAGQAAVQEVKRNLDSYLREWDVDGAVSA